MQPDISQITSEQITSLKLGELANQILLLGQAIVVATKNNQLILLAVYIKLFVGFLFIMAVILESKEQQIAPGVTTPLNKLKLFGSTISQIGAIILTYVLQNEIALREAGVTPENVPTVPPFSGAAFV
ncbi:MAG: hypothetical protein K0R09_3473 [Clostridiales bacterium]|jgi:hypothetical protein|nr:hypothetical protein [Clostridiales bacterium]